MSTSTDARDAALRSSVPIARYAEILAHVAHFGGERTGDVVERFGYSLEAWRELDWAWTQGIAAGTSLELPAQILAFSATFHQHRARLAEQKPALDSIHDKQDKPRRPAEASLAAAPGKSSGVPSFMLAEAARSAAPPAPTGPSPWAAYATPQAEPSMAAPNPPELTIEQHAALHIELELHPEHKAEILRRHGLTPSQHARIDAGWDAQLALNPKLAAAWQQAADKHRARLLGGS